MRAHLLWGLLLAGCASGAQGEFAERKRAVREAFERWNASVAQGDVEAVYRGMSSGMKSHWLWTRIGDTSDNVTLRYVSSIDADTKPFLNDWMKANKNANPDRAFKLPMPVLTSAWLFNLFKETFQAGRAIAMSQADQRRVAEVYVDADGVSILTSMKGTIELYVMVYEGDGWKVDGHRESPMRRP